MNLRGLRSSEGAVDLLGLLGYTATALPIDASEMGLAGDALRMRSHGSASQGYGVLIGTLPIGNRSLRTIGKKMVEQFHDQPLAILGIPGEPGQDWSRAVIVRPRLIAGGAGTVSIAKLTVDPRRPTAHDVAVVGELGWDAGRPAVAQERIDAALDVEKVTKRFFMGLQSHHDRLLEAVNSCCAADQDVRAGVLVAGGAERVALRIVTQVIFCYFLQRKGLLEDRPDWISRALRRHTAKDHTFYQDVLEPLFYFALALPKPSRPEPWASRDIPFLNGGLFERLYGASLPLRDEVFALDGGLMGFLDGWTFTVAEEAADEYEVAVDPEMLGKIFENLVSEEEIKRDGTVYTPRPVVQFMCREALVPYLQRAADIDEHVARTLLTDDEALERLGLAERSTLARRIDDAAAEITVIDPAVGSGAFALGMLTELVRLRRLSLHAIAGRPPTPGEVWAWKFDAVQRSLFGVDINPGAVELCKLRLWLSMLVEEESGEVHPLPNLDYRILCADSLSDFVGGVEVQHTRDGDLRLGLDLPDMTSIAKLRDEYFETSEPSLKADVRDRLQAAETDLVRQIFERALSIGSEQRGSPRSDVKRLGQSTLAEVGALRAAFESQDRRYPVFVPAFHAPDVVRVGGWDVVIMNPPYVGRKEVRQRLSDSRIQDLEQHYGRTYDLMIHFAFRAMELVRPGGAMSMIFNDSIFTSDDAEPFRRRLLSAEDGVMTLLACARSKCFEGRAVNGGVVVAVRRKAQGEPVRWVENHGRPTIDLIGASVARDTGDDPARIGESELWVVPRSEYLRLPHRPLFRPSIPARSLLARFEATASWDRFGRIDDSGTGADWKLLSETRALDQWRANATKEGFYRRLKLGSDWILLGLAIEGGQGLATADDRRFLGVLAGTDDANAVRARANEFAARTRGHAGARALLDRRIAQGDSLPDALLAVADQYDEKTLGWSRIGLLRTVPAEGVRHAALSQEEVRVGISSGPTWVPFEKGDSSDAGGAAKWLRDNPVVIDWSPPTVALLRARARQSESHRKPRMQNEHLWGRGGVTWNRVASFLRTRLVEPGSIFSDKAPTVNPTVEWLSTSALLALMNAPVADFIVRTFCGSRMMVELGDIRTLPIPVLTANQSAHLDALGRRAISAKRVRDGGGPGEPLTNVEAELDSYVRDLYGIALDADLWVVR